MIAAWLLIRPWGDYPLNDDWVFARVTKRFAETGVFLVDTESAPNVLGQSLLATPIIRLFGFSHVGLRLLTMCFACIGLWSVDRILACANASPSARIIASAVLGLNPMYLYLSTTFMTEIYGWVPALLGASIWFWGRRQGDLQNLVPGKPTPLIPVWASSISGILCGSTFWTRQYCVLSYPALVFSSLSLLALHRDWRRMARSLPSLAWGSALFAASILSFLLWARMTGNLRGEFTYPLVSLLKFHGRALAIQGGSLSLYLTAFMLPMLLWFRWDEGRRWAMLVAAALVLSLPLIARHLLQRAAHSDFAMAGMVHRTFPFLGNIIYNAGIGPVTVDDVYLFDMYSRPRWPAAIWKCMEALLIAANLLWIPVLLKLRACIGATRNLLAEVILFGLLLSASVYGVAVQAYKLEVVDRYYFPCVIAAALSLAAMMSVPGSSALSLHRGWRLAASLAALLPVAWFSIAGLHDEFQWSDARWELVRLAIADGAPPSTVQSGYEVNGWLSYDDFVNRRKPGKCRGPCGCRGGYFCVDDSYRVGMNLLPGYAPVLSKQPRYWLANGPAVVLSERVIEN
jgi:hypothetical protein